MAADQSDRETDAPTVAPGGSAAAAGHGMTRLPNGVVLDKDGKPCRTCNSKAAFSAFVNQATHRSAPTTNSTTATTKKPSDWECPPDVEALGRSSWTLLHSMAAAYPQTPSAAQQSDMAGFVTLFSRLYPCWVCAEDFQGYIAREKPRVGSRHDFGMWLCNAHNDVNVKLGKPVFDCFKWEERWRTGPADGSCD